jgi:ATP-dependent RNA helicase RhlE
MSDFKSLDLLPSIQKALQNKGYTTPTPIQAQSIPHLLQGKDLLGIAQTGTGKTAAFSLPIINHLGKNIVRIKSKHARTLILTPTRELASQIDENIKGYSKGIKISSTVVFGGVGKAPQIRTMRQGVDILVATPGRLLDLMNEGHINLSDVEIFVLDEADRMLDMGFFKDVKKVIAKLPREKQTLLFSATMPDTISSLATSLLVNPKKVEITPKVTTVEKIDQSINMVAKSNKAPLLQSILAREEVKSVLIFTRTKHGANRVVTQLEKVGIQSAAIHGNKSQNAREKALNGFRSGKLKILVATDIAARGIDVPHVTHVINYELPNDPESYVHRIGRTARAGREGVAIGFCDPEEMKFLRDIERFIKGKIPVDITHEFHGVAGKPVAPRPPRPAGRNSRGRPSNKKTGGPTTGDAPEKKHSHKHFFRKKK